MPKRKIGFTITCAAGCAPTYVRADESDMSGEDLLDTEDPKGSRVYKGELEVNIVDPKLSLTAMAAGAVGRENKCNFTYKDKPLFASDRKLTEESPGKYRFYQIVDLP